MLETKVIVCSKCGQGGGTMLRMENAYVHQHCQEAGIELKKSQHGATFCPNCGKVLMQKHRKGAVSIGNMNMKGDRATLKCECGYSKNIRSPFGQSTGRDRILYQMRELQQKAKEVDTPDGPKLPV